jgi:hypothetical protein
MTNREEHGFVTTCEEDFAAYERLPRRLRDRIKYAPCNCAAQVLQSYYRHCSEDTALGHFDALMADHVRRGAAENYGPAHPQAGGWQ